MCRDGRGSTPRFGNPSFLRSTSASSFLFLVESVPHIETLLLTYFGQVCGLFGATRRSGSMRVKKFSPEDHRPLIWRGKHPKVQYPVYPLQTWSERVFGHCLSPMWIYTRTVCSNFSSDDFPLRPEFARTKEEGYKKDLEAGPEKRSLMHLYSAKARISNRGVEPRPSRHIIMKARYPNRWTNSDG
jgi:hypothetical protein